MGLFERNLAEAREEIKKYPPDSPEWRELAQEIKLWSWAVIEANRDE